MKYIFEQKRLDSGFAGAKAPRDVAKILLSVGYKPLYYSDVTSNNRVWRNIISFFMILKLPFIFKQQDSCLIQWPLYTQSKTVLFYILKWRNIKFDILIHDLNSIRYNKESKLEINCFSKARHIIVHSESMQSYLCERGIEKAKMKVLTSFDYLVEDNTEPQRSFSHDIVYAGNLEKSAFLLEIMKSKLNVSILCYGKETYKFSGSLTYKGYFNSEQVSGIEGSWGLVWDGDSIDTCDGVYGKYLKINSPHKLSLYIVALLPIIIWEESALADYVVKKGLGYTIRRISDIPKLLSKVTEEDYSLLLENVKRERELLINGSHLKECLC